MVCIASTVASMECVWQQRCAELSVCDLTQVRARLNSERLAVGYVQRADLPLQQQHILETASDEDAASVRGERREERQQ
eukprot:33957-Pleurochrysis_carterae.AAC.1